MGRRLPGGRGPRWLPSYARIKRFAVLPAGFSKEAGELTPTLKGKRKVVAERHRDTLESLYHERSAGQGEEVRDPERQE